MATWAQKAAKHVNNKDLKRETLSRTSNIDQNREKLQNKQAFHTSNKSMLNTNQPALDDNKDDFNELSFGLRYLDNLILNDRKRLLIDHYRIYLSTLDEFKPIFEKIKPSDPTFTRLNWRDWDDFLEKLPTEFWENNKKILDVSVKNSNLPREIQILEKDDLEDFQRQMGNLSFEKESDKEEWLLMAKIVSKNMPAIEDRIFELVKAGLI